MKSVNVLTAAIIVAIASVSIAEQGITKSDLPEPAQKTADAQGAGATVVSYAKDVEKGNLEYEVQLMVAGHTKDLAIDPSRQSSRSRGGGPTGHPASECARQSPRAGWERQDRED
jgi:uncharacterized membrane protein YkoI